MPPAAVAHVKYGGIDRMKAMSVDPWAAWNLSDYLDEFNVCHKELVARQMTDEKLEKLKESSNSLPRQVLDGMWQVFRPVRMNEAVFRGVITAVRDVLDDGLDGRSTHGLHGPVRPSKL